jgi:hypothetical protein
LRAKDRKALVVKKGTEPEQWLLVAWVPFEGTFPRQLAQLNKHSSFLKNFFFSAGDGTEGSVNTRQAPHH